MATTNYRLIPVEVYDPDSAVNFPLASLLPPSVPPPYSITDIQSVGSQIRQKLRSGDAEGALVMALETTAGGVYGADDNVKEAHLATITEVLSSIKASEMTPLLRRLFESEGGVELCDVLAKYLYKGMAAPSSGSSRSVTPQSTGGGFSQMMHSRTGLGEGSGAATMSVLLSWHEKVVEVAGVGCLSRVMSDRRTV
ncbi:MAG: hypothetical protein M1834_000910 [Cirrosporium novae-zelandiae]|nr:MAG: hypothetical protein M1834_000910 [Cirrosporium novae-zelandiae]